MGIVGHYHHIHLLSRDPDTAAEWYVKYLGAQITEKGELRGAYNIRLKLADAPLFVRGERPGDKIVGSSPGLTYGIEHFCFAVDDIEEIVQRVRDGGGTVLQEPTLQPNGLTTAFLKAPDDVDIELIQPKK